MRDLQVVLTGLCAVFLVLSFFVEGSWAAYASVVFGSYFALKEAWGSLRERSLDVNFLMVFAAVGSVALGHPVEAAVLLFLFSLSSTLESFAMSRTKAAIESLIQLRPDTAIRLTDDSDERVPVAELKLGDRVRIVPYDQVPVDGTILEGRSNIDEATMTGESTPVEKEPGDKVLAGTQNLEGMLVVSVTATVGDTALEKIVDLVRDAQENKASGERISQWFGQRYTLFVLGAFAVSLAIRLALGQEMQPALFAALTLLVALSPCALVISTPASTLSALAWAARNGMLIRGGEFIETAGRIDTIAMDKTGTLTLGQPRLVDMCLCRKTAVG
ncbi:MAG: HAD-IC family P-type ATPase, partial [Fimbriimonadaceae bacterium]